MNYLIFFFITTIPAGYSTISYILNFKKLKFIMKRENPMFSGHINNTIDVYRIIIAYINSKTLNKKEKRILRNCIVYFFISFSTLFFWIIIFLFFKEEIFSSFN